MAPTTSGIERAFVTLAEGQVHLRRLNAAPGAQTRGTPLLLFHASPSSSWWLQGLMLELRAAGCANDLVAPDTLGNGDSVAPAPERPDIAYFADSQRRLVDALGFERIDVYGSHTGARIACEFAAAFPERTRRVVLDGIVEYDDDMRRLVVENYAPRIEPDDYGRQFVWAFNFVRDQALHFPWFLRDPAHRLNVPVPPAHVLHRATLDVLKALDTYAKAYVAAFEYRAYSRMPLIRAPVLLLKPDTELPVLNAAVEKAQSLIPVAHVAAVRPGEAAKAAAIATFLGAA
jgi:pimeloyl-ACP methyl ester carboxylesterase